VATATDSKTKRAARVGFRLLAGRDLDGKTRTDHGWATHGTKALTPHGRASRWAHYPHRRRSLIRLAVITAPLLAGYGLVTNWASTDSTLRVIVWLALAAGAWAVVEKSRRWSHYHSYIAPTAAALSDMLGISRKTDPRLWVHVPTGHRTNPDKTVTIDLPETYHAPTAQQKRLADVAAKRLSMLSPDWGIEWEGAHPILWLRASPTPPQLVTFEQVRELAEQTPAGEFVMGLGSRLVPGTVSLAGDSPHIMASIGSGGGKSQFGKWMALQALRRGSRVVIIDIVKRGASHKWAKGVPGVEIYRHPNTAHDALLALSELVENRCEANWDQGDVIDNQQVLLIIEESNRTLRKFQTYWANELGEVKTSMAVLSIEGILCVGREAGVNAVTVGQRMSAAASGGGDARENYGVRLGNRFSRQTARMLFGDCTPLPTNVTHPGRVQVVIGQTATEMQLPYLPDDDQAPVEWALAGAQQVAGGVGESVSRTPRDLGKRASQEAASPQPAHLTVVPEPGQELVSLSQAAMTLGMTRKALANARARDPEFPGHRGMRGQSLLYRMEDIQRWSANRERGAGSAS
jgi:hypothetical protein